MKRKSSLASPVPYCKVHKLRGPVVSSTCPHCGHRMHVHEVDLREVRKGNAILPSCGKCHRHSFLVLAANGKRISLAVTDGNMPAVQGSLGLKVR